MKRYYLLLSLLIVVFLAACGPSSVEEETSTPEPESALENADVAVDIAPRATLTATAEQKETDSEAYPAGPTATTVPEGYPLPAQAAPESAYPAEGETAWVIKPAGEQCADENEFDTVQEARASLVAGGIAVFDATTVELVVASVCGGPTSTHYALEIEATDLGEAEALDWTEVPEDEVLSEQDTVWVMKPAGKQCAESDDYDSEEEAASSLESAGLTVHNTNTVQLNVLAVCGGATSTHYLAEIDAADLAEAEAMGWTETEPDQLP